MVRCCISAGPDRNGGDIIVGQLTVRADSLEAFSVEMTLQGRSIFDRTASDRLAVGDWEQTVTFEL